MNRKFPCIQVAGFGESDRSLNVEAAVMRFNGIWDDVGVNALEYVHRKSFNLIILDMIMDPGIDGVETLKRIKAVSPDQKAILVSGYSETDKTNEAGDLCAGTFLKRPFLLEEIALAVKTELEK